MTQMAVQSQISTGLSVYVYGGLHKVLTLPATAFKQNQFCNVPLNDVNFHQLNPFGLVDFRCFVV